MNYLQGILNEFQERILTSSRIDILINKMLSSQTTEEMESFARFIHINKSRRFTRRLMRRYPNANTIAKQYIIMALSGLRDKRCIGLLSREWHNIDFDKVFRCYAFEEVGHLYLKTNRIYKLLELIEAGLGSELHIKKGAIALICLLAPQIVSPSIISKCLNDPEVASYARSVPIEDQCWIHRQIVMIQEGEMA